MDQSGILEGELETESEEAIKPDRITALALYSTFKAALRSLNFDAMTKSTLPFTFQSTILT